MSPNIYLRVPERVLYSYLRRILSYCYPKIYHYLKLNSLAARAAGQTSLKHAKHRAARAGGAGRLWRTPLRVPGGQKVRQGTDCTVRCSGLGLLVKSYSRTYAVHRIPDPLQFTQFRWRRNPAKNPHAFRAPLAHSGRAQRTCSAATMAALSAIDAGTTAPAIRLPLDPAPAHPRERPFSQESG